MKNMHFKILFIAGYSPKKIEHDGVTKKIHTQIKTFEQFGYDVDYIEFDENQVFLNSKKERVFVVKQQSSFYKTMKAFYSKLKKEKIGNKYDCIYMRYEHISFQMLLFLKHFKKDKKKLVIAELPTYIKKPFKNISFKRLLSFYMKKSMNEFIPKKIDYLATFSSDDLIYGIPTIKIENFIIQDAPLKVKSSNPNELHLLGLAQLSPGHGFDLVLKGLKNYYQGKPKKNVYFHVVGDGTVRTKLEKMVETYELDSYVFFYGFLGGTDLNKIINLCDIGVGNLAAFRKGVSKISELKIREYLMRGLPFVYSADEPLLEPMSFCKKIPFKESPVSIPELIEFQNYVNQYVDGREMRKFALTHFTCKKQMKKIDNVIKQHRKS